MHNDSVVLTIVSAVKAPRSTDKEQRKKLLYELQRFIREQMRIHPKAREKRSGVLSIAEFAAETGVSQSTLSEILNEANPTEPPFRFLIELARVTNTDIREIVALISPPDVLHGSSRPALTLALRLLSLSDEDYKLADKFITGANATSTKHRDEG